MGVTKSSKAKAHKAGATVDIPRPRNSWILFRCDIHELIPAAPAGTFRTQGDLSKMIAVLWKNASEEVRTEYARRAELEKVEHAAKYPGYRFRPAPKGEKKKKQRVAQEAKVRAVRTQARAKKVKAQEPVHNDAAPAIPNAIVYPAVDVHGAQNANVGDASINGYLPEHATTHVRLSSFLYDVTTNYLQQGQMPADDLTLLAVGEAYRLMMAEGHVDADATALDRFDLTSDAPSSHDSFLEFARTDPTSTCHSATMSDSPAVQTGVSERNALNSPQVTLNAERQLVLHIDGMTFQMPPTVPVAQVLSVEDSTPQYATQPIEQPVYNFNASTAETPSTGPSSQALVFDSYGYHYATQLQVEETYSVLDAIAPDEPYGAGPSSEFAADAYGFAPQYRSQHGFSVNNGYQSSYIPANEENYDNTGMVFNNDAYKYSNEDALDAFLYSTAAPFMG
ncbi:hypothetical protein H0H81_001084 [Sphagnurus paluster]|uniref:HMG box domain-containing protein n=1 Tax=Sphagnurus paluster TaxID=117069 RepID=A0A9P7FPQ2_9AGAR|nr:hypothetical protein H0H81_001084 [Sphagnurus paluster]